MAGYFIKVRRIRWWYGAFLLLSLTTGAPGRLMGHGLTEAVFPLSVASGDPRPHGFLLMAHISRNHFDPEHPEGTVEISDSPSFERITLRVPFTVNPGYPDSTRLSRQSRNGPADSSEDSLWQYQVWLADQSQEISVKILIDEKTLSSDQYHYYRFQYRGVFSKTGRSRTLPEKGQDTGRLRLAVLTCQDYTTGYYHAFDYLAREEIDFVLHLGDAIYEYDRYAGMPRKDYVRPLYLPHGVLSRHPEAGVRKANSLADFRLIYRKERSDKSFQRALERHTFIFTRDDHEFADNVAWNYEHDEPDFPEHDPRRTWPEAEKRQVMINALQAWSEYIPMQTDFQPRAINPQDALGSFYKSYEFGSLADLYLIAGRVFRGVTEKNRHESMLGSGQKQWLLQKLHGSRAQWQLLGNQTLMSPLRLTGKTRWLVSRFRQLTPEGALNDDSWDGFTRERQEVLNALAQKENVVVFTGDMHTSLAGYLKKDFNIKSNKGSHIIGAEFMTPSVTSPHFTDSIRSSATVSGFTDVMRYIFKKKNPHFRHFHGSIYGYSLAFLSRDRMDWFVYKTGKKKKRFKKLRKYLYYIPSEKYIGKLNKKELKGETHLTLLKTNHAAYRDPSERKNAPGDKSL